MSCIHDGVNGEGCVDAFKLTLIIEPGGMGAAAKALNDDQVAVRRARVGTDIEVFTSSPAR